MKYPNNEFMKILIRRQKMRKKLMFFMVVFTAVMVLYGQENGSATFVMETTPKPGVKINALVLTPDLQNIITGGQDGAADLIDKETLKAKKEIIKIKAPITALDYAGYNLAIGDQKGDVNEFISNYYGTDYTKSETKYGSFPNGLKALKYSTDSDCTYLFAADDRNNSRVYMRIDNRPKNPQNGSLVSASILIPRSIINGMLPYDGNKLIFLGTQIKSNTYNWNITANSEEIIEEKKPEITEEEIILDERAVTAAITPDKKIIFYVPDSDREKIYKHEITGHKTSLFYNAKSAVNSIATDGMNVFFSSNDKLTLLRDEYSVINIKTEVFSTRIYVYGPNNISDTIEPNSSKQYFVPPGHYTISVYSAYSLTVEPASITLSHNESVNIDIKRDYPIRLLHKKNDLLTPKDIAVSPDGTLNSISVFSPSSESTTVFVMNTKTHREEYHLIFASPRVFTTFKNKELIAVEKNELHLISKEGKERINYKADGEIKSIKYSDSRILLFTENNKVECINDVGKQIFLFDNIYEVFGISFINDNRFVLSDSRAIKIFIIDKDNNPVLHHLIPRSFGGVGSRALMFMGNNGFASIDQYNTFYSWNGEREVIFPNKLTFNINYHLEQDVLSKKPLVFFFDLTKAKLMGFDTSTAKSVIEIQMLYDMVKIAGNDSCILGIDNDNKVNVYSSSYNGYSSSGYYLFFDSNAVFITPGSDSSNDMYTPTTANFNVKNYFFVEQNKAQRELDDSEITKLKK